MRIPWLYLPTLLVADTTVGSPKQILPLPEHRARLCQLQLIEYEQKWCSPFVDLVHKTLYRDLLFLPRGNIGIHALKMAESLAAEPWITLWSSYSAVFTTDWTYMNEKEFFLFCNCSFLWHLVLISIMKLSLWGHGKIVLFSVFFFASCIISVSSEFFLPSICFCNYLSCWVFSPTYINIITDSLTIFEWNTKKLITSYLTITSYGWGLLLHNLH